MELTFEFLQREYYRKMIAYVSTFPRVNGAEREEVAHDALVHAYFAQGQYDPTRPLNAWVYTVARNYILDLLRARGPDTVPYDDAFNPVPDDRPGDSDDPATDAELVRAVQCEIGRLDERDKRIAMLVFFEEMSCADAARALDLPAGTVRWRIHAIRQRLAKKFGERGLRT